MNPITREESLLDGQDLTPITRKEQFIKRIYDKTQEVPTPVTREEWFLKKAGEGTSPVTIEQLNVTENGTYSETGKAYSPVIVEVPEPTLITKSITANGTYSANDDNADGYSSVTVAVDGFKKKSIANTPTDIASFNDGTANPMPSLEISIVPVQSGSGDPSPSNVRPISGWSGANVTRCGVNLFDINGGASFIYDDVAIQNNKIVISPISSGSASRVYFAKTYKPGTYTFSAKMSGQLGSIRFFSPQPFIGGTYNSYYGGYYVDAINEQAIVTMAEPFTIGVIAVGRAGGQGEIYDIQLELSSTATTYSPYQGSTLSIPFHDSSDNPITVYGGRLNVTSGELTATLANIASYNGEAINEPWISSMDAYSAGATPTTGAQVVYPLATPQTYQLTPAQVTTLLELNNIFADCGQILEGKYFVTL